VHTSTQLLQIAAPDALIIFVTSVTRFKQNEQTQFRRLLLPIIKARASINRRAACL
jgi:hypothetical protein